MAQVQEARDDLAGVREKQAPVVARTRIEYPQRVMERSSPMRRPVRRARTATGPSTSPISGDCPPHGPRSPVQPEFALLQPYALPPEQRQKRIAATKGQKKWTRARIAQAIEDLAAGREVQPLKRAPGTSATEPPADLTQGADGEGSASSSGEEMDQFALFD